MTTQLQPPTGTRDFYPLEMARRRWIERRWRACAVRHGFDEIDGPTFEHTELYTRKSGEGIVSEVFGVYSGKDEARLKKMADLIAQGAPAAAPYALRPEFTPTLARMFSARAAQLPRPCRWFWQQTCFRAERPQRGRLREFLQWNCDVLGDNTPQADAEVIACAAGLLESLGLSAQSVRVRYNHRGALALVLGGLGVEPATLNAAFVLLDRRDRLDDAELEAMAFEFGVTSFPFLQFLRRPRGPESVDQVLSLAATASAEAASAVKAARLLLAATEQELRAADVADWCQLDLNVVRGLAYYTGMVFEVHEASGAERAVAGGGRYDNLIETFGGPATPAVGFGMGDVVLSLLLQDHKLMPTDAQIAAELGLRPDVFVISNGSAESDAAVGATVATLRRRGLHARRSGKATKNIGKLLREAADTGARFAAILESASEITLKNLDDGTQTRGPAAEVLGTVRSQGAA